MLVDVSTIGIAMNGEARIGVPVAQIAAGCLALRLHDGATIDDVLLRLEVAADDVQFALVNGLHLNQFEPLRAGDSIALVGHLQGC